MQGQNLGAEQVEAKGRLLYGESKPLTMDFVTLVYFLPLYHPITWLTWIQTVDIHWNNRGVLHDSNDIRCKALVF